MNGEEALESPAVPRERGDYRFPYRARSSLFGALYAGPYGRKAYINSALTALRRSFVPICSTRLSRGRERSEQGGEEEVEDRKVAER